MSDEDSPTPNLAYPPHLFVRVGNDLQEAPPSDQAIARSYPEWSDKGPVSRGYRITILTASTQAAPNQEVRVVHVAEAIDLGAVLYTMGPKPVLGEYVDGKVNSSPEPPSTVPLKPRGVYDGPVVPAPVVDYNYDISSYRFETSGLHRIVWRLDGLISNQLSIVVK